MPAINETQYGHFEFQDDHVWRVVRSDGTTEDWRNFNGVDQSDLVGNQWRDSRGVVWEFEHHDGLTPSERFTFHVVRVDTEPRVRAPRRIRASDVTYAGEDNRFLYWGGTEVRNLTEDEIAGLPHVECARCGESVPEVSGAYSRVYDHANETSVNWCHECTHRNAFDCAHCGEWHQTAGSDRVRYNSDSWLCSQCAESYYHCADCGCACHRSENDYDDEVIESAQDEGLCVRCYRAANPPTIRSYDERAPSEKFGDGPHYLGLELEVSARGNRERAAESVLNAVNVSEDFVFCKNDGSLDDGGFEIVTAPASLEEMRERLGPMFARSVCRGLASFKVSECGLHVHCSRSPLLDVEIAKVVCFVNARHNRHFMEVIAQRDDNSWAKYKTKTMDNALLSEERYEAVNLLNSATIEFRIFKGTLKKESVFKSLEFCAALVAFARATSDLNASQSRQKFIRYVRDSAETYPHLNAFIDAKWYGNETEETIKFGFSAIENPIESEQ